ncbi:hypothetical protein [Nocardia sp. NPDC127526]|uniref:hypothetical protein n=1 Tax=Nocardia sp. NPDC127526 TaxID=3345393 RepID=UPI0036299BB6
MGHRFALGVGVASALLTATVGLTAPAAGAFPLGGGGGMTPGLKCSGITCTNNTDRVYLVSGTVTCQDEFGTNFGTVSARIEPRQTVDLQYVCAAASVPVGEPNVIGTYEG